MHHNCGPQRLSGSCCNEKARVLAAMLTSDFQAFVFKESRFQIARALCLQPKEPEDWQRKFLGGATGWRATAFK